MKPLVALTAALLALPSLSAKEDEKKEKISLDEMLFDEAFWGKALEEIKGPEPEKDAEKEKLREQLKKQGVELGKGRVDGFAWLSAAKDGLRASPDQYKLLGK